MFRNTIIFLKYHRQKLLTLIFSLSLRIMRFLNTPSGLIIAVVKHSLTEIQAAKLMDIIGY
jgi:hypothetical protein